MIPVSILTVTQKSRLEFLKILCECVRTQKYKKIIEWVILDTTGDMEDDIKKLKAPCKIVYKKSTSTIKAIGAWRNEINKYFKGKIAVCMDDDDFYPPNRVSHAVNQLKDKKILIGGVDNILLYDIHFDKIFQMKQLSQPHGTNNTLAYWKEYLNNHSYVDTDKKAEEKAFLCGFSEPIVRFNPLKTVINISHDENTFDKKLIIYQNVYRDMTSRYIDERIETFKDLVNNKKIYRMYDAVFKKKKMPKPASHDIVYYTGGFCKEWNPKSDELRGSEQAVVNLAREWKKKGKTVIVYGNITEEGVIDGVEYSNFMNFHFWNNFKTIIFWRFYGLLPFIHMKINALNKIVDLHDNTDYVYQILKKNMDNVNWIMAKSPFHKYVVERITGPNDKILAVENGVRKDLFGQTDAVSRIKTRFCYVNYYARGLQRILRGIWPEVRKLIPNAELHIYTGIDSTLPPQLIKELTKLFQQEGVFEHGIQPNYVIAEEKLKSNFHLYYTDTLSETDCISIKESCIAGCLPIISDVNIFGTRPGLRFKWLEDTPENNALIAKDISILVDHPELEKMREAFIKGEGILTWEEVADKWPL